MNLLKLNLLKFNLEEERKRYQKQYKETIAVRLKKFKIGDYVKFKSNVASNEFDRIGKIVAFNRSLTFPIIVRPINDTWPAINLPNESRIIKPTDSEIMQELLEL